MAQATRLESMDTDARLDVLTEGEPGRRDAEVQLVLLGGQPDVGERQAVVLHGTASSVLMLVDRINDRVHALREGGRG